MKNQGTAFIQGMDLMLTKMYICNLYQEELIFKQAIFIKNHRL